MTIESRSSCQTRSYYLYAVRERLQLNYVQQMDVQQVRQEDRLREQLSSFRPDTDRLIDILV